MKKVGQSTKKGFTLVELIVVLVILAVLAAMLVPALVGYIDKAKKEKEYQSAATVYAAAQAVITEKYATDELVDASNNALTSLKKDDFQEDGVDEVIVLSGLDNDAVDDYCFAFGTNHVIGGTGTTAPSLPTGYTSPAASGETLVGYVQMGDVVYCLMMKEGTPRWEGVLKSST